MSINSCSQPCLKRTRTTLNNLSSRPDKPIDHVKALRERVSTIMRNAEFLLLEVTASVFKFADFSALVVAQSSFSKELFAKILLHQSSSPEETLSPDAEGFSATLSNPTPPLSLDPDKRIRFSSTEQDLWDHLNLAIDRLSGRLQECESCLASLSTDEAEFKRLQQCENRFLAHFITKIPSLQNLKIPQLLSRDPKDYHEEIRGEYREIQSIRDHDLFEEEEVKSILEKLLTVAQQILDRFNIDDYHDLKRNLAFYTNRQNDRVMRFNQAKSDKLYQDDQHAMSHLQRTALKCEAQHIHFYKMTNPHWQKKERQEVTLESSSALVTVCGYNVAYIAEKGNVRPKMEDMILCTTLLVRMGDQLLELPLWAVMDGHGGDKAVKHCNKMLAATFTEELISTNPKTLSEAVVCNAARRTCLRIHRSFKDTKEASGTTLIFATLIETEDKKRKLYVFNVGDSRAGIKGKEWEPMSYDASLKEQQSINHIEMVGGVVRYSFGDWRVGTLETNIARTLGDILDERFLLRYPTIKMIELPQANEEELILVMGSDGLFGCVSDTDIHAFIQKQQETKQTLPQICQALCKRTLEISRDNVSVLLASLKKSK